MTFERFEEDLVAMCEQHKIDDDVTTVLLRPMQLLGKLRGAHTRETIGLQVEQIKASLQEAYELFHGSNAALAEHEAWCMLDYIPKQYSSHNNKDQMIDTRAWTVANLLLDEYASALLSGGKQMSEDEELLFGIGATVFVPGLVEPDNGKLELMRQQESLTEKIQQYTVQIQGLRGFAKRIFAPRRYRSASREAERMRKELKVIDAAINQYDSREYQ